MIGDRFGNRLNPRLLRLGSGLYALWLIAALLLTGVDQEPLESADRDLFADLKPMQRGLSDSAYQQLLARDIWNHKSVADPGTGAAGLRLVAIAGIKGESRVASVVDAQGRLHRLSVDDLIGDARVVSISPGELVLQAQGEPFVLQLYAD